MKYSRVTSMEIPWKVKVREARIGRWNVISWDSSVKASETRLRHELAPYVQQQRRTNDSAKLQWTSGNRRFFNSFPWTSSGMKENWQLSSVLLDGNYCQGRLLLSVTVSKILWLMPRDPARIGKTRTVEIWICSLKEEEIPQLTENKAKTETKGFFW